MNAIEKFGIPFVRHYTPLHYLQFIARSECLLSKPELEKSGFGKSHFRSMSSKQDLERGFGDYAFLTLEQRPRILSAKLVAGFPHIGISVPSYVFSKVDFQLCRYNVAMTRRLRRGNSIGFYESAENGRYYGLHQIPVARDEADKDALLAAHFPAGTMIEVLVSEKIPLPAETEVICFSEWDYDLATKILDSVQIKWSIRNETPPGNYIINSGYRKSVSDFVCQALGDPSWRGNGLEFDRVSA